MTDQELLRMIARCSFRPTRPDGPYRNAPHEYIVRSLNNATETLFVAMQDKIAVDGYDGWFGRRPFRYYNLGGYKYWIVENILNREKLP